MNTITYASQQFSINEQALAAQGDEWRAIFFKGNADRNFKGFYGDCDEIAAICNAGRTRLEEYTAEEIARHPDGMPSGLTGPGFWTVTCDSDEGKQFDDFWSAAEHILTDDKQNGGTWTADEMVAALKARTPQRCFAMVEALISIGILEEVEEATQAA